MTESAALNGRCQAGLFEPPSPARPRTDMAIVIGLTLCAGLMAWQFEFSERVFVWTRTRERYQIDELPAVLLAFALLMLWFARRRYQEAQSALRRRDAAERQLAHLLEDNRRLALRTIDVQEAERRNLARELHDEMGQYLNAIKIDAVSLQRSSRSADAARQDCLTAIVRNVDHVYWVINDMIRRLRPVGLDELGLAAAIENCVDGWRARLAATHIALAFDGDLSDLDEQVNLTIYRIVQEGLTNAAKHADAAHIEIRLARGGPPDSIVVSVRDNGQSGREAGAQESGTGNWGAAGMPSTGLGLIGMRERVAALNGELTVEVMPPDQPGFGLTARIPIAPGRPS